MEAEVRDWFTQDLFQLVKKRFGSKVSSSDTVLEGIENFIDIVEEELVDVLDDFVEDEDLDTEYCEDMDVFPKEYECINEEE